MFMKKRKIPQEFAGFKLVDKDTVYSSVIEPLLIGVEDA